MKKKQIITYSAIGVGVVLFLAAAGVLVRGILQYREQEEAFTRLRSQLSRLYNADVFPSEDNVALERENREQLEAWFEQLLMQLSEGNIVREDRSPSQFIGRLEGTRNRLRQEGEAARVRLPERGADFAFGFERYAGTGLLPSPEDVPRLTEQLIITTHLARMLYESEVTAIRSMRRDVFEAEGERETRESAPTRRGAVPARRTERREPMVDREPGVLGEDDMFATYRFRLEFESREEALTRFLNALASNPMYTVVRTIRLRKDVPSMVATQAEGRDGETGTRDRSEADVSFLFGGQDIDEDTVPESVDPDTGRPILGASRPVSGIEMETPMQVRLELDVYKFRSADETLD